MKQFFQFWVLNSLAMENPYIPIQIILNIPYVFHLKSTYLQIEIPLIKSVRKTLNGRISITSSNQFNWIKNENTYFVF